MPYSVFDSLCQIDRNYSAVTVVGMGMHAGLVFEQIHRGTGEIEVMFADFLPKDPISVCGSDREIVRYLNGPLTGTPANISNFFGSKREGRTRRLTSANSSPTKDSVKNDFRITGNYKTYRCDAAEVYRVLLIINDEVSEAVSPPPFQVRGRFANSDDSHNCHTWVIEKLEELGITYTPNMLERLCSSPVSSHDDSCHSSSGSSHSSSSGCFII